jgi:epoxide hydrolase-like predicted phosphatase
VIKAIIFDVGGVLVRTKSWDNRLKWENKLGLEARQSEEIVFNSEMGTKAQMGQISTEDLWNWVGRYLNLTNEQLESFRRDFWSGDVLDEELISLIRKLKTNYHTAIISNATNSLRQTLSEIFPISDAFDLIVCSAEEGIMKPDQEIYRRALHRLNIDPLQSIFIDDSKENVLSAQEYGMHTIHYREGINIQNKLRDHGVLGESDG